MLHMISSLNTPASAAAHFRTLMKLQYQPYRPTRRRSTIAYDILHELCHRPLRLRVIVPKAQRVDWCRARAEIFRRAEGFGISRSLAHRTSSCEGVYGWKTWRISQAKSAICMKCLPRGPAQFPRDRVRVLVVVTRLEVARAVDDAPSPPPLGPHIRRTETVAALYEALNRYHFIRAYSFFIMRAVDSKGTQVRGTLASGKTTLATLLFGHIRAEEPNTVVCWIGSWPESIRYEYNGYRGWLLQRRGFGEDGVVIIGEVQNTYWDSGFWNSILKEIGPSSWSA
ncbi:hypothetical protein BKA93DRAFT_560868 [Sparassis latifolia]